MSIQVIHNSNGNKIGVFIPYNEWNKLKKMYNAHNTMEANKNGTLTNIIKGIKEVQQFNGGSLKTTSAKKFLKTL